MTDFMATVCEAICLAGFGAGIVVGGVALAVQDFAVASLSFATAVAGYVGRRIWKQGTR